MVNSTPLPRKDSLFSAVMLLPPPTDPEHFPAHCWAMLEHAAVSREHPWHTAVIATNGGSGPGLRTVVLRHADSEHNVLECHTDSRSVKIAELAANTTLAWLFYDPSSQQQLRCRGRATLHQGDAIAHDAWSRLGAGSRALYAQLQAPASPLKESEAPSVAGNAFEAFCVITCQADEMDWLELSAQGNQRILMNRDEHRWHASRVNP